MRCCHLFSLALSPLLFLLSNTSCAFSPSSRPQQWVREASPSVVSLGAEPRRSVLTWFKRAVMTAGVSSIIQTRNKPAVADDTPLTGPIVEFQLSNLDGEPDKSGTVKIQLCPEWAPKGVDRFLELTNLGFWSDCRFFRVLPGFVVQFGINGDPSVQSKWRGANIQDDPVRVSNDRGTVVFATAGPNTRTTQIFINTREQGNGFLDKQGFSPIGKVMEGMDLVDRAYAGYGEGAPSGKGPNQAIIQTRGNSYLKDSFPKLTFISSAKVL